jgi:osmotically inducible protein OsmC
MADIVRTANATWQGDLKSGTGTATTTSRALQNTPITFSARFEDAPGANPEELIAAAEAACFSMALSGSLGRAGFTLAAIHTTASLSMTRTDDGQFQTIAAQTKETCPVSALLAPGLQSLTLSAKLLA